MPQLGGSLFYLYEKDEAGRRAVSTSLWLHVSRKLPVFSLHEGHFEKVSQMQETLFNDGSVFNEFVERKRVYGILSTVKKRFFCGKTKNDFVNELYCIVINKSKKRDGKELWLFPVSFFLMHMYAKIGLMKFETLGNVKSKKQGKGTATDIGLAVCMLYWQVYSTGSIYI